MKRISLSLAVLCVSVFVMGQMYDVLAIYNPHLNNPALIGSEKNLQIDVAPSNWNSFVKGMDFGAMTTQDKLKSSFGLQYSFYNRYYTGYNIPPTQNASSRYGSFAYAYHHQLDEKFQLSGGIQFNTNYSTITTSNDSVDLDYRNRNNNLNVGIALEHERFYTGISTSISFLSWYEKLNALDEKERYKRSPFSTFHFISGYHSKDLRRVSFDPVFACNYIKDYEQEYSEFNWYAGGTLKLVKIIGLGFTVGSTYSLSASLDIPEYGSLMLGLLSGTFESSLSGPSYQLSIDSYPSYILQLRIKL